MIISKKKFNEKVREALDQAERERWLHERIDRSERDFVEKLDRINKHLHVLEERMNHFDKELKKKHADTSQPDFKEEFIQMLVDNWKWGEEP